MIIYANYFLQKSKLKSNVLIRVLFYFGYDFSISFFKNQNRYNKNSSIFILHIFGLRSVVFSHVYSLQDDITVFSPCGFR